MKGANVTRRRREIRYILSFAILAGLLLIFLVWNICAGSVSISLEEITKSLLDRKSEIPQRIFSGRSVCRERWPQ